MIINVWIRVTAGGVGGEVFAALACVQPPLPLNKNPTFSWGEGAAVHRLVRPKGYGFLSRFGL